MRASPKRSWRLSFAAALAVCILWPGAPAPSVAGETGDPANDKALQRFAVNVAGGLYGIYIGNGQVLTAAHVVGAARHPIVRVAGRPLKSDVVKAGSFEGVDVTLLSIDPRQLPPSLGLRLLPLCAQPPRVGQDVVVATPQAIAHSRIMAPPALAPNLQRFNTLIPDVATTGNSGSGVFDPAERCLMGVMSRKLQTAETEGPIGAQTKIVRDIAKYFVPAAEIRAFLGAGL